MATKTLNLGNSSNLVNVNTFGNILPGADITYDLGGSSKKWKNLYTNEITIKDYHVATATIPSHSGVNTDTATWWKVALVAGYFNFDIYITGGWSSGSPTVAVLNICNRNGTVYITQKTGMVGSLCSQIKLGQVATNQWDVLFYLGANSGGTHSAQYITFQGTGTLTIYAPTAPDTTSYTTAKDLSLSSLQGITLTSSNYNSYAPTKTGTGASGSWGISVTGSSASCTGNASTATKLATARAINGTNFDGSAAITTANWGTARTITIGSTGKSVNGSGNVSWTLAEIGAQAAGSYAASNHVHTSLKSNTDNRSTTTVPNDYNGLFDIKGLKTNSVIGISGHGTYSGVFGMRGWSDSSCGNTHEFALAGDGVILHRQGATTAWSAWHKIWEEGDSVTGAVWNDYAEYREVSTEQPGRCVYEVGDDSLALTTKRLQKGCSITSDTWGFAQGKTEKAQTPIAVSGRVLAYPLENREEFKQHIGDAVCSGPNGTVSIMTDEEVQKYPLAIVGTISAVPDYEEWGGGEGADRDAVKVDGRIWIRIR